MEGNNSYKIPSGFIWRYSICSLGSPPDESHHPVNDSEGSPVQSPEMTERSLEVTHHCDVEDVRGPPPDSDDRNLRRREGTSSRSPACSGASGTGIHEIAERFIEKPPIEEARSDLEEECNYGGQYQKLAEVVTVEVCSLLVTAARLKHRVLRVSRPGIRLLNFK